MCWWHVTLFVIALFITFVVIRNVIETFICLATRQSDPRQTGQADVIFAFIACVLWAILAYL